jgi:integrase
MSWLMSGICPTLEHAISCREVRVAVELIIDTGRRPDEICALRWDCLEYDEDRSPVLVYDNHKNARLGRRLPIAQDTADLINGQKDRVRAAAVEVEALERDLLERGDRGAVARVPAGRLG